MIKKLFHDIGVGRERERITTNHLFLVEGKDHHDCVEKVLHFFNTYQLVQYSEISVMENETLSASTDIFWEKLDEAEAANRETIATLFDELRASGVSSLEDLSTLSQGWKSKTIHTVAHLLDGFFGVDSSFYNLAGESHWVSDQIRNEIRSRRDDFHLLKVKGLT